MNNPYNDLIRYRSFLETIPLEQYREELKGIKWVEQDLPKEILPLASIFRFYWEIRDYLNFEDWFNIFWEYINTDPVCKDTLSQFKKYYFDKDDNGWFKAGFRARMYRTWVSVLTQLDFCYVFESVCYQKGKNLLLECNAELDAKGIDAKVNDIGFQIAKISQRKEARSASKKKAIITIPYAVFNISEFEQRIKSPRVRDKEGYKYALDSFHKYFGRLSNGFVVFKEAYLEQIINNIDDIVKLSLVIEKISSELSGRY